MTGRTTAIAFLVALAITTYDELKVQGHVPPHPQRYTSTGLVYGLLAVLGTVAPGPAEVLAWGMVLALAYNAAGAQAASTDVANQATSPAVVGAGAAVVTL